MNLVFAPESFCRAIGLLDPRSYESRDAVQRFESHSGTLVQAGFTVTLPRTRRAAMAEITLVLGSEAQTTDNKVSGDVKCVVVDRSTLTVTHLVVEPKEGRARLVPLDHVDAPAGKIRLRYIEAEFKNLAAAEEIFGVNSRSGLVEVVTDLVPKLLPTEEEEHRGDHVHATDGEIGQLRALCIDPRTHQVTHVHVLLKEGHLWRHKEVAISSDNVSGFTAGIHLNISKQQVQDLAQADIDHPSE
jgi:sporulation protein YlmC with PRC-barrel domain